MVKGLLNHFKYRLLAVDEVSSIHEESQKGSTNSLKVLHENTNEEIVEFLKGAGLMDEADPIP